MTASMTAVVYGFHGTSTGAARTILAEGFQQSKKEHDWLGDGIYFWQDAPERAWEWTSKVRGHGQDAAVIGARIRVQIGVQAGSARCMDLLDILWDEPLRKASLAVGAEYAAANRPLPRQTERSHPLDQLVINRLVRIYAERGVKVCLVRGAFREGKPVFEGSHLYDRAHVQIAVRDPSRIVGRPWLQRGYLQEEEPKP